MALSIRRAELPDCETVGEILREAVDWLAGRGMPMWRGNELDGAGIASEVDAGLFYVADLDDEAAGTIRYHLADPEFWPEAGQDDAAYVHRLAVRRHFFKVRDFCGVAGLDRATNRFDRPEVSATGLRGPPDSPESFVRRVRISPSQLPASRAILRRVISIHCPVGVKESRL